MKMEKKPKPFKTKTRGTPLNDAPGQFNPFRSVKFTDQKKQQNRKECRGRISDYESDQ